MKSHLEERRKNHEKTSEVVILVRYIGLRVVIVAYEGKCGGSDRRDTVVCIHEF